MIVRDLQIEPLRLRLRNPLVTARGTWAFRTGAVLAVSDGEHRGFGEATPLEFDSLSGKRTHDVLVKVAEVLQGRELPEDVDALDAVLEGLDPLSEAPAARHAVESALLDLVAHRRGVPVARLLSEGAPRARVEVNALLQGTSPVEVASQAREAAERGFRVFKVKVGVGPIEEDDLRLERVRRAVGFSARIRIDANAAWAPEEAKGHLELLCRHGIELCEQPVPAGAVDALRALRGAVPCRIAADESAFQVAQARALFLDAAPAVDVLVLRPMVLGGLLRTVRVAREAAAVGVGSYVASSLDGTVARASAVHVAAALPAADWACGLGVGALFEDLDEGPYAPGTGPDHLARSPRAGAVRAGALREAGMTMDEVDVIARWAQQRPDADALVAEGRRWSWHELELEVREFAARLTAAGVREGDRVAVLSPNRPELVPLFHAAGRLGAIWAPLNARLMPRELAPLVDRLRPRVVLADEALAAGVPTAITFTELRNLPGIEAAAVPLNPARIRALLFTSGTSGRPKAVELTEANFAALSSASSRNLGGEPDQRWLACLPLFHIGGLAMVYRGAASGGVIVLQPRCDGEEVARALREDGITHLSLVPTGLGRVVEVFEAAQENAPGHLRAILVGGGPMTPELLQRARARAFPVLQTYGLTEACSQVCTERLESADGTTSGEPLEGNAIQIVDAAGRAAPVGEIGEIEVRGPTVMRGYFEDPEATAEALRDGWLRTRDLGSVDAKGRLRVVARRSDLIVTGGENVYPAEIEAVLTSHPAVAEVAVVGVEDVVWGEVPVAVWSRRVSSMVADDLEAWSRARLAGFKVPKRFIRVEALPRTGSGKVDRAQLRSLVSNEVKTR